MVKPFKNMRTTQEFGNNPDYYRPYGFDGHEGVDLVPTDGDKEIHSIESGICVRDIDVTRDNYGEYCVIWNKNTKRAWWYCHMEVNRVEVGQEVKEGQVIGIMGATGKVTGAHLHLGLRISDDNGSAINTDNGYKGFINPLIILKIDSIMETYKGIDLSNTDSVKVCVDTWKDVIDGKYKTAGEYNQLLEANTKLKQDLLTEQQANTSARLKQQEQYDNLIKSLSSSLNCSPDEPTIMSEVQRAISAESQLPDLQTKLDKALTSQEVVQKPSCVYYIDVNPIHWFINLFKKNGKQEIQGKQ